MVKGVDLEEVTKLIFAFRMFDGKNPLKMKPSHHFAEKCVQWYVISFADKSADKREK